MDRFFSLLSNRRKLKFLIQDLSKKLDFFSMASKLIWSYIVGTYIHMKSAPGPNVSVTFGLADFCLSLDSFRPFFKWRRIGLVRFPRFRSRGSDLLTRVSDRPYRIRQSVTSRNQQESIFNFSSAIQSSSILVAFFELKGIIVWTFFAFPTGLNSKALFLRDRYSVKRLYNWWNIAGNNEWSSNIWQFPRDRSCL